MGNPSREVKGKIVKCSLESESNSIKGVRSRLNDILSQLIFSNASRSQNVNKQALTGILNVCEIYD